MKLVFFYVSNGPTPTGTNAPWNPGAFSKNQYAATLPTEGYFYLIRKMLDRGIIDDALIIIESNRSPGKFEHEGIKGCVVPEIRYVDDYIQPGDVVWVRGGFRTWHDYLIELQQRGHWLLLYAANTGRERWPFWDIVFDDLSTDERMDRYGRFFLHFKKPTNEEIFKPIDCKKEYDICIGASHIHDKKAQWRIIEALHVYKKQTGKTFKCILPGVVKNGVNTNMWVAPEVLRELNIVRPGMVSREELALIYNKSRLFAYLGEAGQGDRGPLEALACGTPLFVGKTTRLPPVTHAYSYGKSGTSVGALLDNKLALIQMTPNIKDLTHQHYMLNNGLEQVLRHMGDTFDFLQDNKPSKEGLKEYAESRKATIAYNI
jgi:glycosyltransferase involved in cell wall biosynthesis